MAGDRAGRPSTPSRGGAVNRAGLSVAGAGMTDGRARLTSVEGSNYHRFGASCRATSTGCSAGSPRRPSGDNAINRASLGVAHALFMVGAFSAAVGSHDEHLMVARLVSSATGLGAGGPGVPSVDAVDRARVSVTVAFLLQTRGAWLSAICVSHCDLAGAALDATATVDGA